MNKLILIFILFTGTSFAFECIQNVNETNKVKTICSHQVNGQRVELRFMKNGCEFPEGNITDCAYAVSCKDSLTAKKSFRILRKSNIKSLCKYSNTIMKTKSLSLNLVCGDSEDIAVSFNANKKEVKTCKFKF